jgi:hypothetical protein
MKFILGVVLIATFSLVSFAQTANEKVWIGYYAHENDVGKEYFMLSIADGGDGLIAEYKETISAQTTNRFSLDVEIKGSVASFYLGQCLPLTDEEKAEGGRNDCGTDDGYKPGDLILKLKRVVKGKKVNFVATGGKLTEAGFAGELDFVRTKRFIYKF